MRRRSMLAAAGAAAIELTVGPAAVLAASKISPDSASADPASPRAAGQATGAGSADPRPRVASASTSPGESSSRTTAATAPADGPTTNQSSYHESAAAAEPAVGAVVVDPRAAWGTWEGWGTSLAWWANSFGTRDDLADAFFTLGPAQYQGSTLPGLGLNVIRYNVGGGGPGAKYSFCDPPEKRMQGYWLDGRSQDPASSSWDWSADAGQRAMMSRACARGANLVEFFSNSPMWWMTRSGSPEGMPDGSDNLADRAGHAVYLATVAQYAQEHWGIRVNSVEPFNEPSSSWWRTYDRRTGMFGTQEGCRVAWPAQREVLGMLREELDARGLTGVLVSTSDENTCDIAVASWGYLRAHGAADAVRKINTHGYEDARSGRALLNAAVRRSGKALWMSEYGDASDNAVQLALNIGRDLNWLRPTAWVYWQMVFPAPPGKGFINGRFPADSVSGATTGVVRRKYFVMAQYSRHIRPGMQMITCADPRTVAAYDPVRRVLVLVTANAGPAQRISYDLSGFKAVGGTGAGRLVPRWVTETLDVPGAYSEADTYTRYDDTRLDGKAFSTMFAQNTVQTFEIANVDL